MTASVVGAIAPRLERAEIERAQRKPTASLDAYDHFLRGMAGIHGWTREANAAAFAHFSRAIEIDPASLRPTAWPRAASRSARPVAGSLTEMKTSRSLAVADRRARISSAAIAMPIESIASPRVCRGAPDEGLVELVGAGVGEGDAEHDQKRPRRKPRSAHHHRAVRSA